MKKTKRIVLLVLAVVVLLLAAYAGKTVLDLKNSAATEVQEEDSTRFAFENIVPEWLAMPRAASTALYFGLGAYRVGSGDGGANEDSLSQWCTGSALARQVDDLRRLGAGGWALYRYDSLFRPAQPEPAAAERAALATLTVG